MARSFRCSCTPTSISGKQTYIRSCSDEKLAFKCAEWPFWPSRRAGRTRSDETKTLRNRSRQIHFSAPYSIPSIAARVEHVYGSWRPQNTYESANGFGIRLKRVIRLLKLEEKKLMKKERRTKAIRRLLTLLAAFVLCLGVAGAQESSTGQNADSDNTKTNRGRSQGADQQHELASDRIMTQQIRRSIMADKTLSSYAHNVKIITQNGHVTLAGPVRSDEEKSMVAAKAAELAGATNVTNQLEVAPHK